MPQTKEETDTDIKGKQEMDMENEIKSEIKKDKETERQGKCQKENERIMPPVPSNSVFQASPVVVEGLSLDKSIGREKRNLLRRRFLKQFLKQLREQLRKRS